MLLYLVNEVKYYIKHIYYLSKKTEEKSHTDPVGS